MSRSFQKNKNRRHSFQNKKLDNKNNLVSNVVDKKSNNKKESKPIIEKNKAQKKTPIKKEKTIKQQKPKENYVKKENINSENKKAKPYIKENKNISPSKKEIIQKPKNKPNNQKHLLKIKKNKKVVVNKSKILSKEDNLDKVAIEFNDILFSYDGTRKTLDNVNFKIFDNEYVCIIGHNGSGKSTISKVLVGLLKPLNGYISIYGVKISYENIKYLRDNVGIIFQNPDSQFIGLTTEDDIAFGLENKKIHPKVMKEIISNVVKIIGIEDFLKKDSVSLSGGQKQRVAIASVLATNPKIMIFDESTSMLDPKGKKELKETILKLKHEAKKTIISITHDMDEVLNADKVIVMEKGKVKMIGKPSEIFVDEKKLKDLALDFPFSLKLSRLLKDKKVVNKLSINMDDLVESICKK